MNTNLKEALDKVSQLDAKTQAEIAEFINAKADGLYVMSEAEVAACEEGYRDSSKGIFAPKEALKKTLAKLRNA